MQWNLAARSAGSPSQPARWSAGGPGGGGGGFGGGQFGLPVEPGSYLVKLSVGGKDYTSRVVVEEDMFGK